MTELMLLAPGAPAPGATARCRHCGRLLRDERSVALQEGPVCAPRPSGHRSHASAEAPVAQLDLLSMPPDPEDWPITVDAGALSCGRCGMVLAAAGWTLREALVAVEGHAEACA